MLCIGDRTFGLRAVQAALSGYSDRPMRLIARRHGGAELAMNEVVLDKIVLQKGKLRKEILSLGADDHPTGGQLMGSRPDQFAAAANDLVEAGYDLIDINFGCPVRKVLGRCRGGYLLTEPENALAIVRAVIGAVAARRPVMLKMRRGYDDTAASGRSFLAILDGAVALGISAVTVHGRTVAQRYVGPANWAAIARVKRRVGTLPVLGSGDLFSAGAVRRMIEETGVDGVTLARGAIGNPFIFRDCRAVLDGRSLPPPPTIAEQRRAIEDHFALASEVYGPEKAGIVMRKFWIRYSDLHPCASEVRRDFIEARTHEERMEALRRWYDPEREWPPVVRREIPTDLIAAGASLE
ncbi:MAG: tRNA-dihydrouridine synthase [Planctomycetes bacterium]|nr:tRNA-dihydrouridine synthase [Planctomycetota bacterium]